MIEVRNRKKESQNNPFILMEILGKSYLRGKIKYQTQANCQDNNSEHNQ